MARNLPNGHVHCMYPPFWGDHLPTSPIATAMHVFSSTTTHSTRRRWSLYAGILLFLGVTGGWLALDFLHERARALDEMGRLALHKSQLLSSVFGDAFLSADYVLRDVAGRIDSERDLVYPDPDPSHQRRLNALLKAKLTTVSGLEDLVLFDRHCRFTAVASRQQLLGFTSQQRFCASRQLNLAEPLQIEYMPAERSASGKPVVLMSLPFSDAQGQLLGGVLAVIDLAHAQHWIESFELEPNDVMAIVDSDGIVLARNPPLATALGKPTSPPPGYPSFAQMGRTSMFWATSPLDRRERIFGLSRLARFPFVAMVGFDKTRILTSWQHRAWQFLVGFAVLAVVSVLALRAHLTALRQGEAMRKLAITDELTGVANRRHLMEVGAQEVARARRYQRPLSVLMVDIDHFKTVNDRWGHATGDRVIQMMARLLCAAIRQQDSGGRLGGEEFAAVLPETGLAGALTLAERLRARIAECLDAHDDFGMPVRFTVSIGVASLMPDDISLDMVLQRADKALYLAKSSGRNRVEVMPLDKPVQDRPDEAATA